MKVFDDFAELENIVGLDLVQIDSLALVGPAWEPTFVLFHVLEDGVDLLLLDEGAEQFRFFIHVHHHFQVFAGEEDLGKGDGLAEHGLFLNFLDSTQAVKRMTYWGIYIKFTQTTSSSF